MPDPRFGGRDYSRGVGSLGPNPHGEGPTRPRATPPANIGRDRAGGHTWMDTLGLRGLPKRGMSGAYEDHTARNLMSDISFEGLTPARNLMERSPFHMRPPWSRDDAMRNLESKKATPFGYDTPDRYGRMRPTLNPYEGSRIGGGWDEAAVDPTDWRVLQQIIRAGGNPDDYASMDTGIGSLQQMAEVSGKQQDFMNSPMGTPDYYSDLPDYYDAVTGQEDWKQKIGLKDEATQQEVIDYLGESYVDDQGNPKTLPWPVA